MQRKGWLGSWSRRPRVLQGVEKLTLAVEKPIQRVVRSGLLNPLYNTGQVAVILLVIIGISGLYITFFYDFSFDRSYDAVARMNQLGMSRLMRAIHRYAADIFVITVLLHALRTFFTGRFRRPYWLAWSTGWILLAFGVLGGVSGYLLIWDQNAQLLYLMLLDALARYVPGGEAWAVALAGLGPRRASWVFMLTVFVLHVAAWVTMGVLVWLHVRRLQKPQYFPRPFWAPLVLVALLAGALALPAYLLEKATLRSLPAWIRVDLLYLAILPPWLRGWAGPFLLANGVIFAGLVALPWLTRRPREEPKVTILEDRCTGCHLCALDCPYLAISMVEREGPYKYLALVDPEKCVSCSICVGSCDDEALLWGDLSAESMAARVREEVAAVREEARELGVAFTCERHADHAARPFVGRLVPVDRPGANGQTAVYTFAVRCAGALDPRVLTAALDAGASNVIVVGCPPDDCAHRKGNQWLQERLERERAPRLPKEYADAAIATAWVPPNMFREAIRSSSQERFIWSDLMVASEKNIRVVPRGGWKAFLAAVVLLTVPLLAWVGLAHRAMAAYPPDQAVIVLAVDNTARLVPQAGIPTDTPLRLRAVLDGTVRLEVPLPPDKRARGQGVDRYRVFRVQPGPHTFRVIWVDDLDRPVFVLLRESFTLDARELRWIYLGRY